MMHYDVPNCNNPYYHLANHMLILRTYIHHNPFHLHRLDSRERNYNAKNRSDEHYFLNVKCITFSIPIHSPRKQLYEHGFGSVVVPVGFVVVP